MEKVRVFVGFRQLQFFLLSKVPGNDQAEGSDWIDMLNARGVFLEDAGELIWNAIKTLDLS
jgi:hypothetical protein